jgi:hypothetical protein
MDCDTATPLIEALCDDELDVASTARLVAHLEGCSSCAALRREVETRKSALREARPVDRLPDAMRARLVREVGRAAPRPRRPRWGLAAGLAGAALLAGGLATGIVLRDSPPRTPALAELPVVREVTGEVFCLRCALARLFPDTPVLDERHLPVLRTDDGEVITLLDGAVTGAALSQKGCAGRRVALTLRFYPGQELAEVLSVRSLGPSLGSPSRRDVAAAARAASSPR